MYIGNIVTNDKISDEKYNICDDISQINSNFLTIIVGWGLVKEIYGEENVSILNKKIDENTYWTFNNKERKVDLEVDLKKFHNRCIKYIDNKITYIFIDILHDNPKKIKKIIRKIYSLNNIRTLMCDSMIYLFDENLVFGIDLNILYFMGVNIDKIKHKVKRLSKVTLIENEIFNKCSRCVDYNNKKIIPYIYRYGTTNKNNHTSIIC